MKSIYPAIFRKNTSGTYQGFFPDLDGCLSIGETLDDAIEKANEAAYDWITLELSENADLPPVSEAEDLSLFFSRRHRAEYFCQHPLYRRLG